MAAEAMLIGAVGPSWEGQQPVGRDTAACVLSPIRSKTSRNASFCSAADSSRLALCL